MPDPLKIALLKCPGGRDWGPIYESYLERYIQPTHISFQYTALDLSDIFETNRCLDDITFNGYVITGSSCSAYDDDEWIINLIDRIRRICSTTTVLIGLCFGHQIITRALGGEVSLSGKGWGLGPHSISVTQEGSILLQSLSTQYSKMLSSPADDIPCRLIEDSITLHYSHQDQVNITPATVLRCIGGNAHCPFASSYYLPAGANAEETHPSTIRASILTFQGHPEFSSSLMLDIVHARKDKGAYYRSCATTGQVLSNLGYEQSVEEVLADLTTLASDDAMERHALHSSAIGKCIVAFLCNSVVGGCLLSASLQQSATSLDIRNFRMDVLRISDSASTAWPDSLFFFEPADEREATALRVWSHSLLDGEMVRVRGRDWEGEGDERHLGEWEFGLALKTGRRLFLLWNHDVESILIDGVNFMDQLHFECVDTGSALTLSGALTVPGRKQATIILCHGFCEQDGPNYPLMQVLKHSLSSSGYDIIIPDFRPSYKYGSHRGRSERVRIILESLLVDMGNRLQLQRELAPEPPEPERCHSYILIGHSQGGAAVAQVCESSEVVEGINIKCLVLLGSESPTEQLRNVELLFWGSDDIDSDPPVLIHSTRPRALPGDSILCLHAEHDRVIHHQQIYQLAERWGCKYKRLTCEARPDHDSATWANDIQHDFMSRSLILEVLYNIHNHLNDIVHTD